MGVCAKCGNDYDKAFTVTWEAGSAMFDCLECAAAVVAPECSQCGCRILGHGLEDADGIYCCAHCARRSASLTPPDRREAGAL
ncbi:MAG TPA: hypothetical protein VFR17_13375 [Mycobacterium sp.]|nr:hypothetical protein [Mycobacterium sp.]